MGRGSCVPSSKAMGWGPTGAGTRAGLTLLDRSQFPLKLTQEVLGSDAVALHLPERASQASQLARSVSLGRRTEVIRAV